MRVFQGKPMSDEDRLKALSEGEMHHHHHHVVVPKDASPWTRWRAHVFCTFEFPEYSRTAWFLCGFFLLVILMALITFCVESIPSIYKNPKLKKQYHEVRVLVVCACKQGRLSRACAHAAQRRAAAMPACVATPVGSVCRALKNTRDVVAPVAAVAAPPCFKVPVQLAPSRYVAARDRAIATALLTAI